MTSGASAGAPDPRWMREAISEALKGRGRTHPNPSVGAVLVKDGRVVGRGYHHGPGTPHAEVEALREAGEEARGADLYVTLEPCCTYGRTPPCTKALLEAGVARVFAAIEDPNPNVAGRGGRELKAGGVRMEVGLLREEGEAVDPAYHHFYRANRPFVHLKWAQTLDGAVRLPGGGYITGAEARQIVHQERFLADAILVSAGTVLDDDPLLTVRLAGRSKPLTRVVLDSRMRLTGAEGLFRTCPEEGPVWVVRPLGDDTGGLRLKEGAEALPLAAQASGGFDLRELLLRLRERKVMYLYVEAVGRLSSSFLRERLVDRLSVHIAPVLAGGEKLPGPLDGPLGELRGMRLEGGEMIRAGSDWVFTASLEGRCLPD
jgi:diaminohydroxyphosphoribosylaminopyrimidine deaminase/5-amino-6-(5-phosphoribosylamino)uracil reductase